MFYPIYVSNGVVSRVGEAADSSFHPQSKNVLLPNGEIEIWPIDQNGKEKRWNFSLDSIHENLSRIIVLEDGDGIDLFVSAELTVPKTVWADSIFDAGVYGSNVLNNLIPNNGFTFPKSVQTVFQSLEIISRESSQALVLDFFAGSGTTAHAVINLNRADGGRRKYILMEMGEHFNTVILPRVKKVVYSDKWKDGQAQPGQGISHFVKYYDLEQYEDTLRRAHYDDYAGDQKPLLTDGDPYGPYAFLRDLRLMKDTVRLDETADAVNVRLDDLYPGIDLAETLSNVTGKGIRRITRERVEFQDGSSAGLTEPDWNLLKPLLWW